jgi:hypothetical protein
MYYKSQEKNNKNVLPEIDKMAVAQRAKKWAEENYDQMIDLAAALKIKPQALQTRLFSGRSLPGAELLIKLFYLGCDIIWLLTGIKFSDALVEKNYRLEAERNYYKNQYEGLAEQTTSLIKENLEAYNKIQSNITKLSEGKKE